MTTFPTEMCREKHHGMYLHTASSVNVYFDAFPSIYCMGNVCIYFASRELTLAHTTKDVKYLIFMVYVGLCRDLRCQKDKPIPGRHLALFMGVKITQLLY
jgi:hypothetical protein